MRNLMAKIETFKLETQKIREKAAYQLQNWINEAEKAARQTADAEVKREWLKLAGFLHQVLNTILKLYDDVQFNQDLKKAKEILDKLKRWQEQLEIREQNLRLKEEELNRKIAQLQKQNG